ncbi:hypothetical protein BBP40_004300 [Aspergillus hancockii]|nr:hypothetical protein BBP40_004300 [Aspergillus hancockii]
MASKPNQSCNEQSSSYALETLRRRLEGGSSADQVTSTRSPRGPVRFTDHSLERNRPSRVDEKTMEDDEEVGDAESDRDEDAEWDMESLTEYHANQTNDYRLDEKKPLEGIFVPVSLLRETLESGMREQRTWNGEITKMISSALTTDSRTEPKSVRGNGRAKRPASG